MDQRRIRESVKDPVFDVAPEAPGMVSSSLMGDGITPDDDWLKGVDEQTPHLYNRRRKSKPKSSSKPLESIDILGKTYSGDHQEIIPNSEQSIIGRKKRLESSPARRRGHQSQEYPLMSEAGIVAEFRRIVSAAKPNIRIYQSTLDYMAASQVLDILREHDCMNEETILGWIDWYVRINADKKTESWASLRWMWSTWQKYHLVAPRVDSVKSVPAPGPIKYVLSATLDQAMAGGLSLVVSAYGVVVAGWYLLKIGKEKDTIISELKAVLMASCEDDVRAAYKATWRYYPKAWLRGKFLADWQKIFQDRWVLAACKQPKNANVRAQEAQEFMVSVYDATEDKNARGK